VEVLADEAALTERGGGVLKTEKGSEGSGLGCGGVGVTAGTVDSKKEKSASAQASTVGSTGTTGAGGGGGGGVEALAGSGGSVLELNAEKSSSPELTITDSTSIALGRDTGSVTPTLDASSCTSMTAGAKTGRCSLFFLSGVVATGLSSSIGATGLLAGFRRPGPMGPSSALSGTKLFGPNSADVGEIVPRKRAICIFSAGCSWFGGVVGVDAKVEILLSSGAIVEFGNAEMGVDTVGLDIISPQSSSSSVGAFACCC
jgi:hypothetical protein